MIILSIILGVVIMFTMTSAMQLLRGGLFVKEETPSGRVLRRFRYHLDGADWGIAITIGAAVGVINYLTPRLYGLGIIWLAPVFLVVMIGLTIGLIHWWWRDGSEFVEMIPFIILAILFFFTTKATAWATTLLWDSKFWTSVVTTLPTLFLIAALGFFVIDAFYFRYNELDVIDDNDDNDEAIRKDAAARRHHFWGIIAIIITTILLLIFAVKGISWSNFSLPTRAATHESGSKEDNSSPKSANSVKSDTSQAVVTATPAPTAEPSTKKDDKGKGSKKWVHYYNGELLEDKDEANDYNFGPNPVKKELTAEDYDRIFRERLKKDPALAAADTAWLDANVGTRYLGEFYESCKGDWAKTINAAKDRFSEDQEAYYKNLDAFFLFLDHAYEVSIEYRTSGLDDQMYMNPFTASGVPDIVVFETLDHEGWFLVYKFKIKGSATTIDPETGEIKNIEVAYRIDCGFQPTDVEEVMDITPEPNPVIPSPDPTPEPPTPTPEPPTPTPEPPTPTPEPPTPTPEYHKDPEKAPQTDTEPNDDPGPGENTNNGEGANESPKDQPDNSNKYDSYDEYRRDIEELEETNQNQKTGDDSSKPSTPKPTENTNVDNNGKNGTPDSAPINEPTQVTDPAKEAESGNAISDNPGEAWGGPPD